MNRHRGNNQSGFTIVDFLMMIVCAVLLTLIAINSGRAYQASFRGRCWGNQEIFETILLETLVENQQELFQVLAAYVISDPENEMRRRMVITLNPRKMNFLSHLDILKKLPEEKTKEAPVTFLVKDMDTTSYADRILCPLRHGQTPQAPTIDYLFVPTQRWYCMHSKFHN